MATSVTSELGHGHGLPPPPPPWDALVPALPPIAEAAGSAAPAAPAAPTASLRNELAAAASPSRLPIPRPLPALCLSGLACCPAALAALVALACSSCSLSSRCSCSSYLATR
eukprot:scaffold48719_cov34-Phaeocystis_antarctica.AAC.1